MARLTRKDLKSLLKECLLEILREEKIIGPLKESVSQNNKALLSETNSYPNSFNNNQKNINTPLINSQKNSALIESVQSVANAFGKNSGMFADLLADTAMTTLQAQRSGDRLGEGMILESFVEEEHKNDVNALQSLAPEGDVKKWAKFAFAKKE